VHRLFRAVTDFYLVVMERAKTELGVDGVFTSDDLGTQTGPFFGPAIFKEFYRPYYKELIDKAHSLGLHFWLHTCGNIEKYMPEFINLGLDVIHPIQKYTMDEKRIARKYSKDICIWSGFDVQRTIPFGTAEDVRREVRFLMDTFQRPEGRMMFTAGNAVKGDCPIDSLAALFDEAFKYGAEIATKRKA
jgi:uroporphyrinogen decarboxylase